jgi:4a-hydroxytetrahydrobiopterin dehydratase
VDAGAATNWTREDDTLVRRLIFKDFESALAFVERVGQMAVDYQRRPDMCISQFNHVRLTIANEHHAGLTEAEERLAAKTDEVIEDHLVS